MKPFVIYFPQFYAIPTNDEAWGQGFTDWNLVANANLTRAWPRRAPARGFYDGASEQVHLAQIQEALGAGLGGMAVYHYWFYSHQELGAFERTLLHRRAAPTLPWFLVWASEPWSRRWIGDPSLILALDRRPDAAAIERHADHLARCFEHPAYFKMGERPVFAWYHLAHFDEPERVVAEYRRAWAARGFDPVVATFVKSSHDARLSRLVDASYLFEPRLFFSFQRAVRGSFAHRALAAVTRALGEAAGARLLAMYDRYAQRGTTHSSERFLRYLASPSRRAFVAGIPGVVQEVVSPGWNNAPRYGRRFTALESLEPADFARRVEAALAGATIPPLINAWNEWSEGAAVEPCAYLGTRYLEALAPGEVDRREARSAAARAT